MMGRITSRVLVGRNDQLDVLEEALERACAGEPSAFIVSGEAGVGKTRVIQELRHRADERGAQVVHGGCIPLAEGTLPYAPLVAALRQGLQHSGETIRERLTPTTTAQLARLLPDFVTDGATRQEASGERTGLFEAMLDLLRAIAEDRPTIVVVEDMHWSDASTCDVLTHLFNRVESERLLFICTLRTGESDPSDTVSTWLRTIAGSRMAEVLELPPLTRAETREQVAAISGEIIEGAVLSMIFERSGGNPFFVEELVAAATAEEPHVRPSLRELLLTRIHGVPEDVQEIVKTLAVDSAPVTHDLVAAATDLEERVLTPLLHEAIERHLLTNDNGNGYSFRHSLLREAVYEQLLPGERQRLHRSFAEALERSKRGTVADDARAARLSHHWHAAGEPERALTHAAAAAASAEGVYASAEALRHYELALEVWDEVDDPEQTYGMTKCSLLERAAKTANKTLRMDEAVGLYEQAMIEADRAGDRGKGAALRSELAHILSCGLGRGEDALPLMREASKMVDDLPPTLEKATVLSFSAADLAMLGKRDEAVDLAQQAIDIARAVGAREELCKGLRALALAYQVDGDPETAIVHLNEARAVAREDRDGCMLGLFAANLSDALFNAGRIEEAVDCALAGVNESAALGDESYAAFLKMNAAEFLIPIGRWDEAEELIATVLSSPLLRDRVFSISVKIQLDISRGRFEEARRDLAALTPQVKQMTEADGQLIGYAPWLGATLAVWERRYEDARTEVDRGLELPSDTGHTAHLLCAGIRAEAELAARARARSDAVGEKRAIYRSEELERRAAALSADSLQSNVRTQKRAASAEAQRARGRADPELWQEVVSAWDALSYVYEGAYARYRLGEALLATGERAAAAAHLSEAWMRARWLAAAPLILEIEGLARRARLKLDETTELGVVGMPELERADRMGLTDREVEVLRQVSRGLTNKQIAEALYISAKTASAHVSSILTKFGVSRRAEAAFRAHDLGLFDDVSDQVEDAPGAAPFEAAPGHPG